MDNKVNFLRGTSAEYEASTKDNDTFYYTIDDEKLYLGNKEITGGGVTVDNALSDTSENPVQNKVINAALNSKANTSDLSEHTGNAEIHVTADEKAKWNAVNYINPNLLINPDFKINQRGLTEYRISGSLRTYTVDRWSLYNQGIISVVDDGITLSPLGVLDQVFESPIPLGICTFSAKINGTVRSTQVTITGEPIPYVWIADTSLGVSFFQKSIRVYNNSKSDSVTINNFKLELGSIATPFCPPDPATELAKCQRYYQIRSTGDIDPVDLRPTMATITDIKQRSDGNYEYIAEL